jgi:hypothetical protein
MPLNTVGNSVTFNKKLLLQLGIITAVAAVIYLYYNYQEKQQLKQLIKKELLKELFDIQIQSEG